MATSVLTQKTFVRVNMEVDARLASVVEALSEIENLIVVAHGWEGEENPAWVSFMFPHSGDGTAFIFGDFFDALKDHDLRHYVEVKVSAYSGARLLFVLSVDPDYVEDLAEFLASL